MVKYPHHWSLLAGAVPRLSRGLQIEGARQIYSIGAIRSNTAVNAASLLHSHFAPIQLRWRRRGDSLVNGNQRAAPPSGTSPFPCRHWLSGDSIGNFFFALRGLEGHVPFTVVFFRARNISVADSRNQPATR